MSRTSGSIVGKDLAASATTGIFTVQQALTKKVAGNWPNSSGWSQYQISRSLRFNSADSTVLTRTLGSTSNRRTWTWSAWLKITKNNQGGLYIGGIDEDNLSGIILTNSGTIYFYSYESASFTTALQTTQELKDFSSWYHIVVAVDTTQGTSSDRVKMYINGEQVTDFSTSTYPSLDAQFTINSSSATQYIGKEGDYSFYYNGYMTDINFVDGQQLTPSSFGETNGLTGVWQPKAYTGTYGTNGFSLNFSDNSNTTSATLGKDQAGSNDWIPNNFSVTAGVGNDSFVDVPTPYGTDSGAGGEVRGNYCTLNPLIPLYNTSHITISNGNLQITKASSTIDWIVRGTMSVPSSGKWYWEYTPTALSVGDGFVFIGVADIQYATGAFGPYATNYRWYRNSGVKSSPSGTTSYGATYTTNDVIGIAVDSDNGTITFYKNGVSQGDAFVDLSGTEWFPQIQQTGNPSSGTHQFNFGQRPFAYTAPSGFKALCTTNLPDPTVVQGDDHFNTVLYTGTGAEQAVAGVGFQPDFVWLKSRSGAFNHGLWDAVRGVKQLLVSNSTAAEVTATSTESLISFDSGGFTLGTSYNGSGETYVAWNWNAGGSNDTNTDGSITSTVRANPTAGFSIVSYTGTGTSGTIGHGLGVTPSFLIFKNRDGTDGWIIFHRYVGGADDWWDSRLLFTTAARADNAGYLTAAPTSTLISLSTGTPVNGSGSDYILYAFAEVEGYSKFGSYTGNGSADGPFVYCGFRPAFVMIKRTNTTSNWIIKDTKRGRYNSDGYSLLPDVTNAEFSPSNTLIDELSNGFKCRDTSSTTNASGSTYIYAAFAEHPFKYSLAR